MGFQHSLCYSQSLKGRNAETSSADEKEGAGLSLIFFLFVFTILHFQNVFSRLDFLYYYYLHYLYYYYYIIYIIIYYPIQH